MDCPIKINIKQSSFEKMFTSMVGLHQNDISSTLKCIIIIL